MSIRMAGVDHKKAELDIRGCFSFTSRRLEEACHFFLRQPHVRGCVVISTCNRTELWVNTTAEHAVSPAKMLCSYLDLKEENYRQYFTERCDKDAIDHLFRLAAGLESKIVGEGQILTQVKNAVAFARSVYATDNTLEVLFRQAVTAGKRVRSETDLSVADRSIIQTALDSMEEKGLSIKGKRCLVIGNGMMGRLSAQTMLERGANVTVTVRKYHSGVVEVTPGCERIGFDERYKMLPFCDLVVSATSSPNQTLTKEKLSGIPSNHRIRFIDLAVPRDIEPSAADLSWVELYDIDSFQIDIESERFRQNIQKVEKILEEEKERFFSWYNGRDYINRIQTLKSHAATKASLRMKPFMKTLSLDSEKKAALTREVEGATERMMNHLFFELKTQMDERAFREMLDAMEIIMENDSSNQMS